MRKLSLRTCAAALIVAAGVGQASAAVLFTSEFSTFADGDLVGQGGWAQSAASATLPLQIDGGQLAVPGLPVSSGDNQDAARNYGSVLAVDGESIFYGARLTVDSVEAPNSSTTGTSFVLAMQTTDAGAFANFRVVLRQGTAPGTFQFGIRPTGQSGNVFNFGGDLPLGSQLNLLLGWDFIAGAQNDLTTAWIDPTSPIRGSNATYATNTQANATGDAPGFQGVLVSQFTNSSLTQAGLRIDRIAAATTFAEAQALIPEPASLGLLAVAGLLAIRRR